MDRVGSFVVTAPVRRAGDPGSGPGEDFYLKLIIIIIIIIIVMMSNELPRKDLP